MRIKTARQRRNRNIWKRRGHTHIVFNRGTWTYSGAIQDLPEGFEGMVFHVPFENEQPNAYTKYPHA